MVELRRHARVSVDLAVEIVARGSSERRGGRCRDLSVGGMFVQTSDPLPFGTEIVVHLSLPAAKRPLALPAVVRWTRARQGMGLQFGLLGARETHAITELARAAAGRLNS